MKRTQKLVLGVGVCGVGVLAALWVRHQIVQDRKRAEAAQAALQPVLCAPTDRWVVLWVRGSANTREIQSRHPRADYAVGAGGGAPYANPRTESEAVANARHRVDHCRAAGQCSGRYFAALLNGDRCADRFARLVFVASL